MFSTGKTVFHLPNNLDSRDIKLDQQSTDRKIVSDPFADNLLEFFGADIEKDSIKGEELFPETLVFVPLVKPAPSHHSSHKSTLLQMTAPTPETQKFFVAIPIFNSSSSTSDHSVDPLLLPTMKV